MKALREARDLLALAVPIAAVNVGQIGMGWIDTAIVGRISTEALAGVGIGATLASLLGLFGHGLFAGVEPIVAQRLGSGRRDLARAALRAALSLVVPLALLLAGLAFAIDQLLLAPNAPGPRQVPWLAFAPGVAATAREYLWARVPGLLPLFAFAVCRAWLCADRRPGLVLGAILLANVVHLGAAWLLVFGNPGLGVPSYGPIAAGWASSASYLVAALCLAFVVARERKSAEDAVESPDRARRRLLAIGVPIGLQTTLDGGVFTAVALLMNGISALAGGAHQITSQLVACTFVVALGLGSAAAVRVGHAIGARDLVAARRSADTTLALALLWMGATGSVFWLHAESLAHWFTADPELVKGAAALIRIAALFQLFDGMQAACSGALRGAGSTRFPFLANLVGLWLLGFPVGCGLAFGGELGSTGLWLGLTVGIAVVGASLVVRMRMRLAGELEPIA